MRFEAHMTRSIVLAALLAATLAACAPGYPKPMGAVVADPANAVPAAAAPADAAPATAAPPTFVPYCGAVWNVDKQGYEDIPCPPGSGYASGREGQFGNR